MRRPTRAVPRDRSAARGIARRVVGRDDVAIHGELRPTGERDQARGASSDGARSRDEGAAGGGGVSDGDREVFWLAAREGWVSGRVVDAF